jgi:hypothetical protein
VYPANVNIFAMTLSSAIKYLKIRITAIRIPENKTCIFFLVFSWLMVFFFLSISKISILKEVVKEVKAV